jgi:hypothetical protein
MKMGEVQAGLGRGVKKFSAIFVFETRDKFDQLINSGWEFGGLNSSAVMRLMSSQF